MLDPILSLFPGGWIAGAVAAIGAVLAIWFGGRRSAKSDAKAQAGQDYIDTRRRIDDAMDEIHGDDPAAARRFLHERGKRPGDL